MSRVFLSDFTWIKDIFAPSPDDVDYAELKDSYQKADKMFKNSVLSNPEAVSAFLDDKAELIIEACDTPLPPDFARKIRFFLQAFVVCEPTLFKPPPRLPERKALDLRMEAQFRRHLQTQLFHLSDVNGQTNTWLQLIAAMILEATDHLPSFDGQSDQGTITLSAPLITLARDPATLIMQLINYVESSEAEEARLFNTIREYLYFNVLNLNRITPEEHQENPKSMRIKPRDLVESELPEEAALAIFKDTPFTDILLTEIPIPVPEETRFEHMHILAGTGHGKTQTLQHLIVSDLQRPPEEVPSMVILDSQGDMLNTLKRLALFDPMIENSLARRLLIVDPSDVHFAPALNLFDIQSDRLKDYNQRDREQVLAGIIEIYDYIFGGLLEPNRKLFE